MGTSKYLDRSRARRFLGDLYHFAESFEDFCSSEYCPNFAEEERLFLRKAIPEARRMAEERWQRGLRTPSSDDGDFLEKLMNRLYPVELAAGI